MRNSAQKVVSFYHWMPPLLRDKEVMTNNMKQRGLVRQVEEDDAADFATASHPY